MHLRARLSKASQMLQVVARFPVVEQQLPGACLEHGLAITDGCCCQNAGLAAHHICAQIFTLKSCYV